MAGGNNNSGSNPTPPTNVRTIASTSAGGASESTSQLSQSNSSSQFLSASLHSEQQQNQIIADITGKIEVEKKVLHGATLMFRQLSDLQAREACEASMVETKRRLEYLEGMLRDAVASSMNVQNSPIPPHHNMRHLATPNPAVGALGSARINHGSSPVLFESPSLGKRSQQNSFVNIFGRSTNGLGNTPHASSYRDLFGNENSGIPPQISPQPPGSNVATTLDLLKYGNSITTDKVNYRRNEVLHKLDTEQKVKTGTENLLTAMLNLNTGPVDQKIKDELKEKMAESNAKITVLEKSKHRYHALYVSTTEEDDVLTDIRRKCTGRLKLKLFGASNLVGRTAVQNEAIAVVAIDGIIKYTSRRSSSRWDETLDVQVDRAQEVEICVYSHPGGMLLGLIWFKIGDLEDDLKAKNPNGLPTNVNDVDDLWLDLEPAGQILIRACFGIDKTTLHIPYIPHHPVAATKTKTQRDQVFRREAVQKAFPRNGHKFYSVQSLLYQCAVCNEFSGSGTQWYQCQGCNYMCHAKCYGNVITKCITLADIRNARPDEDLNTGQLLNYRIPHRFQPKKIVLTSWCAHCGVMMGPGARMEKCTECGKCAHTACKPMVPNFCELTPDMAITLVQAFEDAERRKHAKELEEAERQEKDRTGENKTAAAVAAMTRTQEDKIEQLRSQIKNVVIKKSVKLEDFDFLAVLGRGAFGKVANLFLEYDQNLIPCGQLVFQVMLIEEKTTKKLYAMKALKKEFIIQSDDVASAKLEKRIFQKASESHHPFLVNLHSCFQTDTRLYFVMEYVCGGDLMCHIQEKKRFSQVRTKFYASEVLLALEFFHKNNIIYRDLKLDNILMCPDGHIKVADYGICKENMPYGFVTTTYCGTPDYMAPEILNQKDRYGRAVDWWSFGILIYVMLVGKYPFRGDEEGDILEAIMSDAIDYPPNMPHETLSLIQGLLKKDPKVRLGGGRLGAEEVKRHPYFQGQDWEGFMERRVVPPWKPVIKSERDVSNFDAEFTRERPVLTPIATVLGASSQAEFRDFDFTANWAGTTS
ncbi:Serine/threonine kinase [Entophlyctis sp. JEL0112]|nr:Serine/threonine kinase [Entophlyctis sp. JEL0112]